MKTALQIRQPQNWQAFRRRTSKSKKLFSISTSTYNYYDIERKQARYQLLLPTEDERKVVISVSLDGTDAYQPDSELSFCRYSTIRYEIMFLRSLAHLSSDEIQVQISPNGVH